MAKRRPWPTGLFLTALLTGLLATAITEGGWYFTGIAWLVIVGAAATVYRLFPHTSYFALSFANFVAVYACIYMFIVETNFGDVGRLYLLGGFVLPIAGFVLGIILRRRRIVRLIAAQNVRQGYDFLQMFGWLLPMAVIAGCTFILPDLNLSRHGLGLVLIGSMALIALIVGAISQQVAAFLLEAGALVETFFQSIEALAIPAFAFITFYSLNVIVFAAIYRIVDRLTDAAQFLVHGMPVKLSFSESLYFSIVSLSTVGYGDIVPGTGLVRVIAAFQVVSGVLLLLFGFNEILRFSRERARRNGGSEG